MNYWRINLTLAALIAITVLVNYLLQPDYSRPNYNFLPGMQYSPAYGAYSRNLNFANGRTPQGPVAGTLARGEQPLHYQATPEDALRAGEELRNPIKPDDALAFKHGAGVYPVFCIACHGATGAGDGTVVTRGVPALPISTGNAVNWRDGHLFHIVTYGKGAMASYAGQLTPYDRWCVIRYLRSLQVNAADLAAKNAAPAGSKSETGSKDVVPEETPAEAGRKKSDDNSVQDREEINQ